MLPANAKELIARLDPGSFTALVESLLVREAARAGVPLADVVMSDAITEADEGLDGLLRAVPTTDLTPVCPLPSGEVGIQLKTVRRKWPGDLRLPKELAKPGPRRVLTGGGTYIVVWSQDLNPGQRTAAEKALQDKANKVQPEARVQLWDALTIAQMLDAYPDIAAEIGISAFERALSLAELLESTGLRANERPFISDAARDDAIARVRERAGSEDHLLMTVIGDPGAGKTRVVAQALDTEELAESVLYVNGAEDLELLLNRLQRNKSSRGILFVDEIDETDLNKAVERVAGLGGRWRLISCSSRASARWVPESARNLVLPALSSDATRELVERYARLPDREARMVAEVAAGFPELAFRLADELRADPVLDLVRLARLPQPEAVLKRALSDDEARKHLAPMALFTGVGVEGELRYQLEGLAEAFALSVEEMARHADAELRAGRFVSKAGRYRLVSPRIVAIWLATDLIERTVEFEKKIVALPEPLQDAFTRQLEHFGPGVPQLPEAIGKVISRFRSVKDFTEAAGRLFRASAAIIPELVAETISELLEGADDDDLLRLPRRDLVWTLQILLWWPATWKSAIESLYLLARHENESWANNATSQFSQFFSVYLAGTTVPHASRLQWLMKAIDQASNDAELQLLSDAARAGLEFHRRMVVGFRGGAEPPDWQPTSTSEYIEARRGAWKAALLSRDRVGNADMQANITKELSKSFRVLFEAGLASAIERDLQSREWSSEERAALSGDLRGVVRYSDDIPEDAAKIALELHDWLLTDDLKERLTTVLQSSTWDLHFDDDEMDDAPRLLDELAGMVTKHKDGLDIAFSAGAELEDQQTRYIFFRLLVQRTGAPAVGNIAMNSAPPDWTALSAALSLADRTHDHGWATNALRTLANSDHANSVPELLRFGDLTPERIQIVIDLIDAQRATPEALSQLLYGARIVGLQEDYAIRVMKEVAKAGNIESALGMLQQWIEKREDLSQEVRLLASEFALMAVRAASERTMSDYHIEKMLSMDILVGDSLVELWEARIVARPGLPDKLDQVLTKRALERDPQQVLNHLITLIERQGSGDFSPGLYSSGQLGLLSRAAEATSVDEVWDRIKDADKRVLVWAVHHMDWTGDEPHSLVRRLLESDRLDDDMASEAFASFYNTLGVVGGPYHMGLKKALDRAQSWERALSGGPADRWSADLVKRYESDIEWHRQREAEENLHFL